MIRLVFLLLTLSLAACAPMVASRGLENDTPTVTTDSFLTRDGLSLPLRRWDATHTPRAIIVALHGMSDYSNAFDMPATYWATQGITTYAYDQRGFGRAPNTGIWPGSDALESDLDDCVDAVRAKHPHTPVFVLGESMGGAVVLAALAQDRALPTGNLAANPSPEPSSRRSSRGYDGSTSPQGRGSDSATPTSPSWRGRKISDPGHVPGAEISRVRGPTRLHADGVILVAPAVWARSDMPASYRTALFLGAHLFPSMKLSGNGLGIWPSDNVPMLRKLSHDPLFQHSTRADAVYGLVDLMDEGHRAAGALTHPPPILFVYGKNDQVIPEKPTKEAIAALGSRAEVHRYDHGWHMLLRDLDRQLVFDDIVAWMKRVSAR